MLSYEEKTSINNFLNEATWLHLYLYPEKRSVGFALHVLTLPESGPETDDIARGLVLFGAAAKFLPHIERGGGTTNRRKLCRLRWRTLRSCQQNSVPRPSTAAASSTLSRHSLTRT